MGYALSYSVIFFLLLLKINFIYGETELSLNHKPKQNVTRHSYEKRNYRVVRKRDPMNLFVVDDLLLSLYLIVH